MLKSLERWLPGYLRAAWRRPRGGPRPLHVILAVVDHYEPLSPGGHQPVALGLERVARWRRELPALVAPFRDADGRPPQHTFFYPEEEYQEALLAPVVELCQAGLGEVEIHLHHDHDTAAGLTEKLTRFRDLLRTRHGLLGSGPDGRPRFAFIHGNWALGNPFPDGRHCGVDQELKVLAASGCYCDLTMPSGPSPTQTRLVNAIYYARDVPGQRRPADRGVPVVAVTNPASPPRPLPDQGDLLLIQGPLALNWRWRKWGLVPRLEHADLCGSNPPTPGRLELWLRQRIGVQGRPDWVFIKLHTHGCLERNMAVVLGPAMAALHRELTTRYNDGAQCCLHYVTARELYNLVKAAEAGVTGPPGPWRDFVIAPPPGLAR